jgi:hypothetical protein
MIFDDKPIEDVLRSLEGEVAKTLSELRCARSDLNQAESRLKFCLATIHYLKQRDNDSRRLEI